MNAGRSTLISLLFVSQVAAAGELLDIDSAVQRALAHSPDIITAQAEVAAAEARQRQAARWLQHNPEVEGAAGPRRDDGTSTDYSVELSQQVEISGQPAARRAVADAQLESARARLAWQRVEVGATVRESFGRVLAARQRVELAREAESTAEHALAAADKSFRVGDVSRLDINTARVERARATHERNRTEQDAASGLTELRLLLALPADEPLVVTGELSSAPPPTPPQALQGLIDEALQQRADLRAARFELEEARAENTLAARRAIPQPRLGAAYAHEEGAEIVRGIIGIELPVFDRNQAERGNTAAQVIRAEQALQALRRRSEQEVRLAEQRLRAAEQVAAAYAGEVVGAMRENLELSTRAYQAGNLQFTQLLLIRRESLQAQREYIAALEELNSARIQMNRVIGRE